MMRKVSQDEIHRIRLCNARIRNENHLLRCTLRNISTNPYSECGRVLNSVIQHCTKKKCEAKSGGPDYCTCFDNCCGRGSCLETSCNSVSASSPVRACTSSNPYDTCTAGACSRPFCSNCQHSGYMYPYSKFYNRTNSSTVSQSASRPGNVQRSPEKPRCRSAGPSRVPWQAVSRGQRSMPSHPGYPSRRHRQGPPTLQPHGTFVAQNHEANMSQHHGTPLSQPIGTNMSQQHATSLSQLRGVNTSESHVTPSQHHNTPISQHHVTPIAEPHVTPITQHCGCFHQTTKEPPPQNCCCRCCCRCCATCKKPLSTAAGGVCSNPNRVSENIGFGSSQDCQLPAESANRCLLPSSDQHGDGCTRKTAKVGGPGVGEHASCRPLSLLNPSSRSALCACQDQTNNRKSYIKENSTVSDDKDSVATTRPCAKILGELAFQLERRILDYVFGMESSKRRRFYGYTVNNICQMMNKESKNVCGLDDPVRKSELAFRLKKLLIGLKKFGYDIKVHGEFAQQIVNTYGLLPCPPDSPTIQDFGLHNATCIATLIDQLASHETEAQNLHILLNSLKYLAKCDGRPLFVW